MNIEIKPGHQSFCIWYVYVDGEPVGDRYDSYRAAEDAAQRIEDDDERMCEAERFYEELRREDQAARDLDEFSAEYQDWERNQ